MIMPRYMLTHRHVTLCRPRYTSVKPVKVVPMTHDIVETSYYIGKGITLFTMFYCTMNWWMYKRAREDQEDDE